MIGHASNLHLQRAILKYGLAVFTFKVIEQCDKSLLFSREQHWLNWLFDLPENLRYNFSPTADSPLGVKHTPETRAKISAAKVGNTNAVGNSSAVGHISPIRKAVFVYTLEDELVQSFNSLTEASNFLGVSKVTVSRAVKLGYTIKGQYRVRTSTT